MKETLSAALDATALALAELSDEEILVEWFRGRRLLREIRDRLEQSHGKDLNSRTAAWAKEMRKTASKRGHKTQKENLQRALEAMRLRAELV